MGVELPQIFNKWGVGIGREWNFCNFLINAGVVAWGIILETLNKIPNFKMKISVKVSVT